MKLGFFGWLFVLLVAHVALAVWSHYEYETDWTWAIVALALLVGHIVAYAGACLFLHIIFVGALGAIDSIQAGAQSKKSPAE